MRIKAEIMFEIPDELGERAEMPLSSPSEDEEGWEEWEKTEKAWDEIFQLMTKGLQDSSQFKNVEDARENTPIKDYKFFKCKDNPLLFEM